jgi:hypothetical protein
MTRSEPESSPEPYPTATSPEKHTAKNQRTPLQHVRALNPKSSPKPWLTQYPVDLDPEEEQEEQEVEEEQRRAQIQIHKEERGKRERKASDPNPSPPTSSEPRRCLHLQMHGGHESEGEREERKGVAPLTESCHRRALLRRHGERVGRSGEEGRKGGRSGSRMAESAAACVSGGSGSEM